MSKQSINVVRDWHPVRRAVAAGAMSVVLASAMALPAFAATGVDYSVGDTSVTATGAFTDDANGISWDGGDAITMKDANLDRISITGDATVQFEGESNVGGIYSSEGDLTLNGDVEVPAEEKPILNIVNVEEESYFNAISVSGTQTEDTATGGNLTISGLTVNLKEAMTLVLVVGDATIDNSKLAVTDVEDSLAFVGVGGETNIVESVVDLGTGGALISQGVLTINNSDVSVRASEGSEYSEDDPYTAIRSNTDIVLINEANGEVKYFEDGDAKIAYVDTGDGNAVFLKAASTPGYYTGTKAKAMPQTGDATGTVVAGLAAAAVAALGALGISRRRGQSEE